MEKVANEQDLVVTEIRRYFMEDTDSLIFSDSIQ